MKQNEIYEQMSIFDGVVPNYQIKKPTRLIELFSGIGAQAKALEILGVPFEHYKTCEDDYTACDSVGLSKSAIYHCAGDSIATTCLIGLFSKLIHSGNEHIDIIRNYIEKIKE